ncbi:MAG: UDP-GlcNAc:UDP-phosphate GlcNAc-phosphate transferase [Mucilaginibacter sp.]|nr:UDP-GlcNAc:UDP-phosphate GlcNAc-phosphate transferase [Mucilaginibacter sp.]
MDFLTLLIFFIILFALELVYFKIADKYNIIDQPNHRSSHTKITIRGGGIIFSVALLIGSLYTGWQYSWFLLGLFLISLISFIDDVKTISNRIRIVFHLVAVALLFYQLGIYNLPLYWKLLAFIFVIGTINAINFMDGINGITGGYGLITLLTLYYINKFNVAFTEESYLLFAITSLLVFDFFNFRKKAKCFAGDVGSVSLAFIILFFLLQLMIKTNNINYVLLLLVYGLDAVTTIAFRMIRKENVFEAHRSHYYQFLANDRKVPHLLVAALYMLVQGVVNVLLIKYLSNDIIYLAFAIIISAILFLLIRFKMEGIQRLLSPRV